CFIVLFGRVSVRASHMATASFPSLLEVKLWHSRTSTSCRGLKTAGAFFMSSSAALSRMANPSRFGKVLDALPCPVRLFPCSCSVLVPQLLTLPSEPSQNRDAYFYGVGRKVYASTGLGLGRLARHATCCAKPARGPIRVPA